VRLLLALVLALVLGGAAWAGAEHFRRNCDASSAPGYARKLAELSNARMPTLRTMQRGVATKLASGMGAGAAADLRRLSAGATRLASDIASIQVPDYKTDQQAAAVRAARRVSATARTASTALRERNRSDWQTAERALTDATTAYNSAIGTLVYTRHGCPNTPDQYR
jgi:hypothetical protein